MTLSGDVAVSSASGYAMRGKVQAKGLAFAQREGVRLLLNGAALDGARTAALARVCHTLFSASE